MALTKDTADRIDAGLALLTKDQAAGLAPPPGRVSIRDIATRAGVSTATIHQLEALALAKLHHHLSQDPEILNLLRIKPQP
jgi:DNA-directed RNA polymerase specialized sigma24 family protein